MSVLSNDTARRGIQAKHRCCVVYHTSNIQPDGKEPRTDWDCVAPVAAIVGSALLAAASAGTGVFLAVPAYAGALAPIATSTAVTVSGAAVFAAGESAAGGLAVAVGTGRREEWEQ